MPIVLPRQLRRSIFHGCIVPPMWNAQRLRFAHVDHAFLTKTLWRREPPTRFLRPSFFAVPGLGRTSAVRNVALFGDEFVELEEHFDEFLEELEGVLRQLRWSQVHANLHGQRSGTHRFTWRATTNPERLRDDGPTQDWAFEGPR